jgi:hypothetical protein
MFVNWFEQFGVISGTNGGPTTHNSQLEQQLVPTVSSLWSLVLLSFRWVVEALKLIVLIVIMAPLVILMAVENVVMLFDQTTVTGLSLFSSLVIGVSMVWFNFKKLNYMKIK